MQTTTTQPTPEIREILETLLMLPPEQVDQVRDFARFLQERYGKTQAIDHSDSWSEQDMRDLRAATLAHAEHALGAEEGDDGSAR